jgi:hypothetical protein
VRLSRPRPDRPVGCLSYYPDHGRLGQRYAKSATFSLPEASCSLTPRTRPPGEVERGRGVLLSAQVRRGASWRPCQPHPPSDSRQEKSAT